MTFGKDWHWRRLLRHFLSIFELYTIFVLLRVTFLVLYPYDPGRLSYVAGFPM
jgi:hypothetical protein